MLFQNKLTEETMEHTEFVSFVWDEAKRQFEENTDEEWCNLTKEKQIEIYCEQFEHQLNERDWKII